MMKYICKMPQARQAIVVLVVAGCLASASTLRQKEDTLGDGGRGVSAGSRHTASAGGAGADLLSTEHCEKYAIIGNSGIDDASFYSSAYREFWLGGEQPRQMRPQDVLAEPLACAHEGRASTGDACDMTQLELTVVVGVYKRPDIFSTLVDSIIFSTARVRRLWIVCNGSPYLELFRAKAHELAESLRVDAQGGGRAIEVAFFGTEKEVGYYERFLRALVVDTQYLAFIDDDMVIGRRVLEVCLHALNTRKFYGLIGIHGPLLPDRGVVDGQHRIMDQNSDCRWERAHFQNAPSALTDFLYNFWVGETDMFRYMFRSSPLTLKTGEDMMLSFAVQHHAKLRCLSLDVCELEPDDELFLDFCGDCLPSLKIENRSWTDVGTAEAARGRKVPALALEGYASDDAHREHTGLRQRVLERLWRRGWPLVFTREWASRAQAPELLVVADEQQARVAVADNLLQSLDATWLLLGHGHFVHAPRTDAAAAAAAASIASILGVEHEFVAGDLRIFELDAGQWQPHTESFPGRFAHVLTSVQSVIEAARPTRVVVIDDGSIESSAAAASAALLGIRVKHVQTGGVRPNVASDILRAVSRQDSLFAPEQKPPSSRLNKKQQSYQEEEEEDIPTH